MPIPRRLAGTLTQTAVDAAVTVTRQLGTRRELYEGIRPLYFGLSVDPIAWCGLNAFIGLKAQFDFPLSEEKVKWYMAGISFAASGGGMLELAREWYIPAGTPLLFEEEVIISFDTVLTALTSSLDYVFYYDIVQSTELVMVQESTRYVL